MVHVTQGANFKTYPAYICVIYKKWISNQVSTSTTRLVHINESWLKRSSTIQMESTTLDSANFTTLLAQRSDNTNSTWHSEFYRKNTKDKILEWEGTSRSVHTTQLTGPLNLSEVRSADHCCNWKSMYNICQPSAYSKSQPDIENTYCLNPGYAAN